MTGLVDQPFRSSFDADRIRILCQEGADEGLNGSTASSPGVQGQKPAEIANMLSGSRLLGCREVQGYLFGRPMSSRDFGRWLRHNQARWLPRAAWG
ncbi:MAG: hypothetical protein ACK4XK_00960 [Casimicrobiaceae bacterium]